MATKTTTTNKALTSEIEVFKTPCSQLKIHSTRSTVEHINEGNKRKRSKENEDVAQAKRHNFQDSLISSDRLNMSHGNSMQNNTVMPDDKIEQLLSSIKHLQQTGEGHCGNLYAARKKQER